MLSSRSLTFPSCFMGHCRCFLLQKLIGLRLKLGLSEFRDSNLMLENLNFPQLKHDLFRTKIPIFRQTYRPATFLLHPQPDVVSPHFFSVRDSQGKLRHKLTMSGINFGLVVNGSFWINRSLKSPSDHSWTGQVY